MHDDMKLYAVQTRDNDTTGRDGHYSCYVRAKSHREAALILVDCELEKVREAWADDENVDEDELPTMMNMENGIAVLEISRIAGPRGFINDKDGWTWEEFSVSDLLDELKAAAAE
jgi:hypothetical protein